MTMENENEKLESGELMKRDEFFLTNPRTLVALTFGFLALTLSTKIPAFFILNLFFTMFFAYYATNAAITEIKEQ